MQMAPLLPILALALTTGCYETPRPPCAFACGPADDCPAGYSCRADSWCKRDDVGDDFACAPPVPDAAPAPIDASPADAAAADASPDAAPDAAIDAMSFSRPALSPATSSR